MNEQRIIESVADETGTAPHEWTITKTVDGVRYTDEGTPFGSDLVFLSNPKHFLKAQARVGVNGGVQSVKIL